MRVSYLILLTFILTACGRPNHDEPSSESAMSAPASAITQSSTDSQAIINAQALPTQNTATANKQLIIQANLQFLVDDVTATLTKINAQTTQYGGYIADSQVYNSHNDSQSYDIGNGKQKELTSYNRYATVIVRIPKDKVNSYLDDLAPNIKFLQSSQLSAKDVTLDILKNQLQAQIEQQATATIEDSITENTNTKDTIRATQETKLNRTQALYHDIEQQAIADQVAFSTISLSFSEPAKIYEQITSNPEHIIRQERTNNFMPRLREALSFGWVYFLEFILAVSHLWMFLVVIIALAFAMIKFKKRKSKPHIIPIIINDTKPNEDTVQTLEK